VLLDRNALRYVVFSVTLFVAAEGRACEKVFLSLGET